MQSYKLRNRAVESVTINNSLNRKQRALERAQQQSDDNILSKWTAGPLEFKVLKNSEIRGRPLDTSKRYTHIGNATEKWRSNRAWVTTKTGLVTYAKGKFALREGAKCNPQIAGKAGPRLPSLPLPPFKRNDVRTDKKPKPEKEQASYDGHHIKYLPDADQEHAIYKFVYDDFLTSQQNCELAAAFRKTLFPETQLVSQSGVPCTVCTDTQSETCYECLACLTCCVCNIDCTFPDNSTSGSYPPVTPMPYPPPNVIPIMHDCCYNARECVHQRTPKMAEYIESGTTFSFHLPSLSPTAHSTVYATPFGGKPVPDWFLREYHYIKAHYPSTHWRHSIITTYNSLYGSRHNIVSEPLFAHVVQDYYHPESCTECHRIYSDLCSQGLLDDTESTYSDAEDDSVTIAKICPIPNFIQDVSPQPSKLQQGLNYITSPITKIQSTITNANSTMDTVRDAAKAANSLTVKAEQLMDRITAMVSSLPSIGTMTADLSGALFNLIYDLINYRNYSLPILVVKAAISIRAICRTIFPSVKQTTLSPRTCDFVSQSMGPSILTFLTGSNEFLKFAQTANAFHQLRNGFNTARAFTEWLLEQLPECMKAFIARIYPHQETTQQRFAQYLAYGEQAKWIILNRGTMPRDLVDKLIAEHTYFHPILAVPTADNRSASYAFKELRQLTYNSYEYLENFEKFARQRETPFSLLFQGATRAGKSVLITSIVDYLTELEEHKGTHLYTRQAGTDHWDAFQEDTFCTVYDDILQDTAYDDVAEIFAMLTRQHYVVPMSSLDDPSIGKKGTLNLSKMVVAATNVHNEDAVSTRINCPAAFWARWCMRVIVIRTGEYDTSGDFRHLKFQIIPTLFSQSVIFNKPALASPTAVDFDTFMTILYTNYNAHYANEKLLNAIKPKTNLLNTLRALKTNVSQGLSDLTTTIYSFYNPHYAMIAGGLVAGLAALFLIKWATTRVAIHGYSFLLAAVHHYTKNETAFSEYPPSERLRALYYLERNPISKALTQISAIPTDHVSYNEAMELLNSLDLPKLMSESRSDANTTVRRPQATTESRSDANTVSRRPQARSEAQRLDVTNHSKMANSPFYQASTVLANAYPSYESEHPHTPESIQHLLTGLISQGSSDPGAISISENALQRMVPITLLRRDASKHYVPTVSVINYVNAIPISSTQLLCPKHLLLNAEGKMIQNTKEIVYELVLRDRGVDHTIELNYSRIKVLLTLSGSPTIDAMIIDCGHSSVAHFKSMLNQFISEQQLSLVRDGLQASMVGYTIIGGKPTHYCRSFEIKTIKSALEYSHQGSTPMYVHSGVVYSAATSAGDCGSPIIVHHPAITGKIVAIHTFGHKSDPFGGATLITREMILRQDVQPDIKFVDHPVTFHTTPRSDEIRSQNLGLQVLGELDIPVYVARDTAYRPTPLLPLLAAVAKHPSNKVDSEGFDPLLVGGLLFGSDLYTGPDQHKESIMKYLMSAYRSRSARILTATEAVNSDGGMDRLNLETSAGYPHALNGRDKRHFLANVDGTVVFRDSHYRNLVDEYITSWQTTQHDVVWITSLKDELVKPGKLARVFEIPPLEYTIACRAYYGSWIAMMHETAGQHFCAVGINPESFEWTKLFQKLLRVSPLGIDADAPNWDKNLAAYLMFYAIISMNRWYQVNDPNWCVAHDEARIRLASGAIHGFLTVGWLFVRKFKGMPSGWVLTALLNSLVNMIMHLIWYLESTPLEYRDVMLYDKFVCTIVYGDDSLDAIAQELLPYLNRQSMLTVYKRYCSMTITSSAKDDKLALYDPIMDLQFLKRDTRRDALTYKPLLCRRSMFSMLAYVRKSKHVSLEDQLLQNIDTFFRFAYFYGPEFYNQTKAFTQDTFPNVRIPDYVYFDNLFNFGTYVIFNST